MNLFTCYYIDLYRDTLRNLDRKQTIIVHNDYSMFSLTWPASMQIYWNKRKRLHKKRVQMAAVLLFWDTNKAAMTTCENTQEAYSQLSHDVEAIFGLGLESL